MRQLITVMLMLAAMLPASAQRIQTVDEKGEPVPYVSVLTTDAQLIGITDFNGVIDDVKGADIITVSHVAYKPNLYKVNGKSGRITLVEADFGLPEVTVTRKPMVYSQTYYRMYVYEDSLGIIYYRSGLTDNSYDRTKKKLSADTRHTSKAIKGIVKTLLNMIIGKEIDRNSRLKMPKIENMIINRNKIIGAKLVQEGPDKKRITSNKGTTLGYVTDNRETGLRRISYEPTTASRQRLEAEGKTKELAKRKKNDMEMGDRKMESYYFVYRIDDDGNYSPEDMMMHQYITSWDKEKDGRTSHRIIAVEVYNTDRAYVTKDELKQLKKDNRMNMTYDNIRQFEKTHKIPALLPAVQKRLNELWRGDSDD